MLDSAPSQSPEASAGSLGPLPSPPSGARGLPSRLRDRLRFARWTPLDSPPLERGHPLLGNVLALRDRPIETLAEAHRRHGDVVCLDMKVRPLYVLNDAEAMRHVLQDYPFDYQRGGSLASDKIRVSLGFTPISPELRTSALVTLRPDKLAFRLSAVRIG